MLVSKSNAYSFIEVIFIILILGILLNLAISGINNHSKICEIKLSTNLIKVQNNLALAFSDFNLSHKIQKDKLYDILKSIEEQNSLKCGFKFNQTHMELIAYDHKNNTTFKIIPKDLSNNPKILCQYQEPFCKKLSNRTKDK